MDTKRLTGAFTAPIKESLLTASCAPAAAPSQGRSRETQRSEGSWRTGGTEAGEGRHHQLSSHFQPVGCNTALHSPDHLYKTPRKNSGILPFKICISPPRHTHRKKKKDKLFITLPPGFSLTNYFTLLPSHFCCLPARQARFIWGCWSGHFLCSVHTDHVRGALP